MKQKVVIIGHGAIGGAIKSLLKIKPNITINLWDIDGRRVKKKLPLIKTVPQADFLFLCIPSRSVPPVLDTIAPMINKKTVVIAVAKGIERQSKKFIDQFLASRLGQKQPIALLYGPMLATELKRHQGGVGVVAAKKITTGRRIGGLFSQTTLATEYSTDLRGVAVVGVLKNIYALILGIADGLNWGKNKKGWLITQSIREMTRLVKKLGGKEQTVLGFAGLGDLITTGFSTDSRNSQVGRLLAESPYCPLSCEGCISLPIIVKLAGRERKKLILLKALFEVSESKHQASVVFKKVFNQTNHQ
ncbi:MAG: hypothetical protein A2744_03270 [Candidatus Buchananbacteria bacterium RIFCSPHIGHO2_01_FULL_44_11]|uniref:Glycerol-3-phosphate dehydrogenase (NAD(P)(+)) n=1 Tax=Candidatus Buchananbacteria bacterium RIFCSPHIGHO2_01_FULL_44_11 TaxID=1797535 RepID=A0A1G1Y3P8_9BACT|nr:MAG: hypothetical protein A2744_03270 [Candidatus Buchananbacteria bacterium RIFCSPHIGHO2_01_FULL_44_11]